MTERKMNSTLPPSGDKEANLMHAGNSALPATTATGESSLFMMGTTPHTRHRESLAMGTSATNSGGGPALAAPAPPTLSFPFSSPVDTIISSFPQPLQTPTPKPLFMSHSLSRDENAMKRLEERDNQKMINEPISFLHGSDTNILSESNATPMCISPGNAVVRRQTEHTKQRRESVASRVLQGATPAGSEPSSAVLSNVALHQSVFRSPVGGSGSGGEGREWNQHQDPRAMLGALSNSAPSGKIGVLGNPYPFSSSLANGSAMAQDSGGIGRVRMGVSPTLDGVGGCVPPLPTDNSLVELPMRQRRGVGMGFSLPSPASGGGGSGQILSSYPPAGPFSSPFQGATNGAVTSEGIGLTAPLPSAEAEKGGGSSGRKSGEGERIAKSGTEVCRPTPHAQLREGAAEVTFMSSSSLSFLADSKCGGSPPKETEALVSGKGGIVEVVPERGGKSADGNENSKFETSSPALSGDMRSIEDPPSRFPGDRTLPPQEESSSFSSLPRRSEKSKASLMVNYWKSKNVLQRGKQTEGVLQGRDIPIGGYSAPVGFGPVFPPCAPFSKGEQEDTIEGDKRCPTIRSGVTATSIHPENDTHAANAWEAVKLEDRTHDGNTLDKGENVSPFSLATSVPAYYRTRPSLNSASKGSLPRQVDDDAAARMRSALPPQGASPLLTAPMSSSLGGVQKRATMHALLRDGVCTEDGGVPDAEAKQAPAGVAPAKMGPFFTSSSGKTKVEGGAKERMLPASDWSAEELENGEYAT